MKHTLLSLLILAFVFSACLSSKKEKQARKLRADSTKMALKADSAAKAAAAEAARLAAIEAAKPKELSPKEVATKLYAAYARGEINQGTYKGETYYSCQPNAYDAPTTIFDAQGAKVVVCNYAFGQASDPLCSGLQELKTVYRPAKNIWGKPAVDVYGLTD